LYLHPTSRHCIHNCLHHSEFNPLTTFTSLQQRPPTHFTIYYSKRSKNRTTCWLC